MDAARALELDDEDILPDLVVKQDEGGGVSQ